MKWWNDLWINEGFATYYGHVYTDRVANMVNGSELEMKKTRGSEDLEGDILESFSSDYYGNPKRPLRHEIKGQQQLNRMDLNIVYGKGGAMVKMFVALMGEKSFNNAMRKYIDKFKFKNADQYDLFEVLQTEFDSSKVNVLKLIVFIH